MKPVATRTFMKCLILAHSVGKSFIGHVLTLLH